VTPRARSREIAGAATGETGRSELIAAAAASAMMLVLHAIFMLRAGAPWRDEINSVEMATMPSLRAIASALGYDSFPIGYTLLLRAWIHGPWGGGEPALRALGFLVGGSLLAALWFAARALGARTPWLALALFGWSTVACRATDSIRPFGLGTLADVLAFALIGRLVERPGRIRFVNASLAAVAAVQCSYTGALLLTGAGFAGVVVALRRGRGRTALAVLGVVALAAASLVPYAGAIRTARDWAVLNQLRPGPLVLGRTLISALGAGLAPAWLALAAAAVWRAFGRWSRGVSARPAEATSATATAAARDADAITYSAVALVASAVAFLGFLVYTGFLTEHWYYVPLMAFAAAALNGALGTAHLPRARPAAGRPWPRAAVPAGALALAAALAWGFKGPPLGARQTNMDLVARKLEASAESGDLILVNPWYFGVSFRHYYSGAARWTTLPPLDDLRIHRYDLLKRRMQEADPIQGVLAAIEGTLRSGHRVWLIGWLTAPPGQGGVPVLPPAPASGAWRWSGGAYLGTWAMRADALAAAHVTSVVPVEIETPGPVSHYENVPLNALSGWAEIGR